MADRDWGAYNEALVRRGEVLLDMAFLKDWSRELKGMNHGKEGARYRYPESFMRLLAILHAYILPYRQLEGFIRALADHVEGLKTPDFTTIAWRVSKMKLELDSKVEPGCDVVIAVDSSGIKVSKRGDWITHRRRTRRGWLKIHLAVDVRSRQILALEVTREDVHDTEEFKPLLEEASSKARVEKAIGDGAYDSEENFNYLAEKGIKACIRVRRSSRLTEGETPREAAVREQLQSPDWKKRQGYGYRWIAESAISSLKRTFGEHVSSTRWRNMVKELILKASIYNLFISMNP